MTANETTTNSMKTLKFDVIVVDRGDQFAFKANSEAGVDYFEINYGNACCGLTIQANAFAYHFKKMSNAGLNLGMY